VMQGISNRRAGICLFSSSIVIVGQSGHAQTAAQNRIVQQLEAGKVSPLPGDCPCSWLDQMWDGILHSVLVGIDANAPSEICHSTFLDRLLSKRTNLSRNVDSCAEDGNSESNNH
jgi:hypothetical protein